MPDQPKEQPPRQPTPFQRAVAARLAKAREAAGLDQIEASKKIGLGVNAVGLWERAVNMPSAENLVAACDLYGVSTDSVLGLSRLPDIAPGHAVVDLSLEKAILEAKTLAEAQAAAEQRGATTREGGIQIGYKVPAGFGIVPNEAFDQRVAAVNSKLASLSNPPAWARGRRKGRGSDEPR